MTDTQIQIKNTGISKNQLKKAVAQSRMKMRNPPKTTVVVQAGRPKKRGPNNNKPKGPKKANKASGPTEAEIATAKKAIQARIEEFLLGKKGLFKGFVYNRQDQRPVFQRIIPFTKVFQGADFDAETSMAFNLYPNPFRTLEMVVPPTGGNRAKDKTETVSVQTHGANPLRWCFDHDITCVSGSITASNHVVAGLEPCKHYSTGDNEFKEGNKLYMCGPSLFNVEPSITISNVASYEVFYRVQFVVISGTQNHYTAVTGIDEAFSIAGDTSSTVVLGTGFGTFQTLMTQPDTAGFAVVIECNAADGNEITMTGSDFALHLSQESPDPGKFPVFGSAYSSAVSSVFEIIGDPARALAVEIESADTIAVTAYALLITNYTAPLNKAGRIMGVQVPADHTKAIALKPTFRFQTLFDFPNNVYKMLTPIPLNRGCHFSTISTPDYARFIPTTAFQNPDKAKYNRPYAAVVIDGKGAFSEGTVPNLQFCGWLNIEWRGTSMTFTPQIPPANVALFVEVLDHVLGSLPAGSLWGENPDHFDKIKRIASTAVNSKLMKTVIRDVATVGVETLASIFV